MNKQEKSRLEKKEIREEGGENERYTQGKKPGRRLLARHREAMKVRCTEVRKVIIPEAKGK